MKHILYSFFIILVISVSSFVFAQTTPEFTFNAKFKLFLNDTELTTKTSKAELIELLGEPDEESGEQEVTLTYAKSGFLLTFRDDHLIGIGFNFNWDGDKRFPAEPFSGKLKLGDYVVTQKSTTADFTALKEIDFICPVPIMCGLKNRKAPVSCMAGFDNDLVTQVLFVLND